MTGRKVVLVVDDEALTRELVAVIVESEEYAVHSVDSGAAALDAARTVRPDVVLLDLTMPDKDGFSVCRELRADPLTRDAQIVVLSGRSDDLARVDAAAAGADGFLVKPYSARDLFAALERSRAS